MLGKLVNTGVKGGSTKATQWSVVCEGIEGKPSTYQLKKAQSFAKGPGRQSQPRMHIISEGVCAKPRRSLVAMVMLTPFSLRLRVCSPKKQRG